MRLAQLDRSAIGREIVAIVLFMALALVPARLAYAAESQVMYFLDFAESTQGDSPPWYFIERDFAAGLCAFGSLIVTLIIAAITSKFLRQYAWMLVWMTWLWQGGNVLRSWIIYQSCPGLLDGDSATTSWMTFDSYLHDSRISSAYMIARWGGFLLAVVPPLVGLVKMLCKRSPQSQVA